MIPFFVAVTFILQIVLVLVVINLYLRQNRLVETEARQKQTIAEMEDAMLSFIMEIREENELFLKRVQALKEKEANNITKVDATASPEVAVEDKKQVAFSTPQTTVSKGQAILAYQQTPTIQEPKDSFLDNVIALHEDGHSARDIAKIYNKGTTEIELLLKFRQKEQ